MNFVPIAGKELYEAIERYKNRGGKYTKEELSAQLGRCDSYITARIREGSMKPNDLERLCVLIRRNSNDFYREVPEGFSVNGTPPRRPKAYVKDHPVKRPEKLDKDKLDALYDEVVKLNKMLFDLIETQKGVR